MNTMTRLIDEEKLEYNAEAANMIYRISQSNAASSYHTDADVGVGTRNKYADQFANDLQRRIRPYIAKCVVSIIMSNGLNKYLYLDSQNRIVKEGYGTEPEYGMTVSEFDR